MQFCAIQPLLSNRYPTKYIYYISERSGESVLITDGATRVDLSQTVVIPNTYTGDDLQLFISFKNAEETQLSNSIYIGSGTAS